METMTTSRRRRAPDSLPPIEEVSDTPAARAVHGLMERSGMTSMRALSLRIGANAGYINDLFAGNLKAPGSDYAVRLAEEFQVSVGVVLGQEPLPDRIEPRPADQNETARRFGADFDPKVMAVAYPLALAALGGEEGAERAEEYQEHVFALARDLHAVLAAYAAEGRDINDSAFREAIVKAMAVAYANRLLQAGTRPKS